LGLCFDGALRFVASYWLWWQDIRTGVSGARVKEVTVQIGMIGLGGVGANMARRLIRKGHGQ